MVCIIFRPDIEYRFIHTKLRVLALQVVKEIVRRVLTILLAHHVQKNAEIMHLRGLQVADESGLPVQYDW